MQVWLAAMPPGAEAGQLGPAEQLGQLRAQQRRLQGALARVAALEPRIAAVRSAEKNHGFAIAVCEYGESYV